MFELKISFSPEAEGLLTRLCEAAEKLAPSEVTVRPFPPNVLRAAAQAVVKGDEHPVVDPFPAAPVVENEAPAPEPVKEYTLEEVRAKVNHLIVDNDGMRAKVKAILNKYAEKIVYLKKTDYAAFMAELEGLE